MSDTSNHLPTSYPDLKTCSNIILRHLVRVKIFVHGTKSITGEVGQIHLVLVLKGGWPLHLGSLHVRQMRCVLTWCVLCTPCTRWKHHACTRRVLRAPDDLMYAPVALHVRLLLQKSIFFFVCWFFTPTWFKTTSKHCLTLQNFPLWYVWLQTHVDKKISFKFDPFCLNSYILVQNFNLI